MKGYMNLERTNTTPTNEQATRAMRLACKHFDVEHLNVKAVVIFENQVNALTLTGWLEDRGQWEAEENGNLHYAFPGQLCDANVARKLACILAGHGVALHPGDPSNFDAKVFYEFWYPILRQEKCYRGAVIRCTRKEMR